MGSRKQGVIISRSYSPASDECVRALELLMKKSVKEGGPPAPKDDMKGPKRTCRQNKL